MVGAEGFEPPTACSQSRCATRLRYAPNVSDHIIAKIFNLCRNIYQLEYPPQFYFSSAKHSVTLHIAADVAATVLTF